MLLAAAARALERGRFDRAIPRAAAKLLEPVFARGLVRPERVPSGTFVVCVGGATLGGSGKTRVAIACTAFLAALGARVTLIGHGYRGKLRAPKRVRPDDDLAEVGDEALVCARALTNVDVVVGPSRQSAIDHALRSEPDALVIDGPLAIASEALSVLALDADRPWGAEQIVPAGDLRAPRTSLLRLADHIVPVRALPAGVRWGTTRTPLASLERVRFGLFTALARPERLARSLEAVGIRPAVHVVGPDHGPAPVLPPNLPWVATEKCALHLPAQAEVGIFEAELSLPAPLEAALRHALTPPQVRIGSLSKAILGGRT